MGRAVDPLDMGGHPILKTSDYKEQNRRTRLALAIAQGMSVKDAAKAAGLEFSTASKLVNSDEVFWVDVAWNLKRQAATRYAPGALATLVTIHEGDDMPAYARIAAARTVLELADLVGQSALKWRDSGPQAGLAPTAERPSVQDPARLAGDIQQVREQLTRLREALNNEQPRQAIDQDPALIDLD